MNVICDLECGDVLDVRTGVLCDSADFMDSGTNSRRERKVLTLVTLKRLSPRLCTRKAACCVYLYTYRFI
jgi:hypothetical protein